MAGAGLRRNNLLYLKCVLRLDFGAAFRIYKTRKIVHQILVNVNMNKKSVLDFIHTNNLIGIKAGPDRQSFLDIWMVVVDERIFARSWGFAERSWYNSFLQNPDGQLKCGEKVVAIKASIPADKEMITEKINLAYLTKYNSGQNIEYAKGIVEKEHIEKTMEFLITE